MFSHMLENGLEFVFFLRYELFVPDANQVLVDVCWLEVACLLVTLVRVALLLGSEVT
jgi:hypothetical protein